MSASTALALRRIDHVAIYAAELERSVAFYERVLGGIRIDPPYLLAGRVAVQRLRVGGFALSLHQHNSGAAPVSAFPTIGGADLCFECSDTIERAIVHLRGLDVEIIEGPVARRAHDDECAHSIYFRDPDGNLLELLVRDTFAVPPKA